MALTRATSPTLNFDTVGQAASFGTKFKVGDRIFIYGDEGVSFDYRTGSYLVDNGTVFQAGEGYLVRNFEGPARSSWFSSWSGLVTYMSLPGRSLIIDNEVKATSVMYLKSLSSIKFTTSGVIIPNDTPSQVINILGSEPTAFLPIAANMSAASALVTFADGAGISPGDNVVIKSDRPCDGGPNSYGVRASVLRRVLATTSAEGVTTALLDQSVHYNFLVSENAVIGKYNPVEDVELVDVKINKVADSNALFTVGISMQYCNNVRIKGGVIQGSKRAGSGDITGRSAIKFANCRNSYVDGTHFYAIGWYGVEVLGASEDIQVRNIKAWDVRHAISLNWQATTDGPKWGEPITFKAIDCIAHKTILSGFDTHDIGKRIQFLRCISYDAGDDGFQARAHNVEYIGCKAYRPKLDGFASNTNVSFPIYRECIAYNAPRAGFNASYGGGHIYDCEAHFCADGIRTSGGTVQGGRYTHNSNVDIFITKDVAGTQQTPLHISEASLRYDGDGRAVYFHGKMGIDPALVTISDCDMTGHGLAWALLSGYTVQPTPPRMSRNTLDDVNVRGIATLVAGTATVNARVRGQFSSNANTFKWVSEIKLTRLTYPSNAGPVSVTAVTQDASVPTPNPDLNSFTIKSANAADVSQVMWEIFL